MRNTTTTKVLVWQVMVLLLLVLVLQSLARPCSSATLAATEAYPGAQHADSSACSPSHQAPAPLLLALLLLLQLSEGGAHAWDEAALVGLQLGTEGQL